MNTQAVIRVTLLAVAVSAATAPAAWAAKPKLYTVSLSGDVRNESTLVRETPTAPDGCTGTTTETHRFVASAGLTPKPSRIPVASYGRLRFRAALTSPTVASTTETVRSFVPDPSFPPDDPSVCAVPTETTSRPCTFSSQATSAAGADFALLPNAGRYELYYNRNDGILSCDDDIGERLLDVGAPKLTNLRVRAVKRLAKGRTASASATVTTPPLISSATGGETLRYALKVKRVR
jgi:hypothetical protein